MARVFLARSARDALAALDFVRANAVLDALAGLERDPDAGYELRGRLSGLRSCRVGAYRIIYERRDPKTVRVVANRTAARPMTPTPVSEAPGQENLSCTSGQATDARGLIRLATTVRGKRHRVRRTLAGQGENPYITADGELSQT